MKKTSLLLLLPVGLISCSQNPVKFSQIMNESVNKLTDTSDNTNNFYDNTGTVPLPVLDLIVEGEISNPGEVDFSALPLHSVIVKETLIDSTGSDKFIGAYRYDGYSLFNILDKKIPKKANASEFNPVIDLFVEIVDNKGQKVVFSWGEIFYPNNLHKIIIASGVSRIVPSKTKELWPLPSTYKLVAANDLVTGRNISGPIKITVRSFPESFKVIRGMSPMYSPEIRLFDSDSLIGMISSVPGGINNEIYNTIFYGRGKGIHSIFPFTGVKLKDIIKKYYPSDSKKLRSGIFCLVGQDGYRCVISYSELFNRNDQQEFLLVETLPGEDGGLFRIFPAGDFFSDRAIKSVSEIHLRF